METLLSLTSRRAGEWFKEELRDLGGLEHIIKTVVETCSPVDHTVSKWTPELLDRLKKADRCLRVLENVNKLLFWTFFFYFFFKKSIFFLIFKIYYYRSLCKMKRTTTIFLLMEMVYLLTR